MCDTCGCNLTPGNKHLAFKPVAKGATAVSVLKGLLAKNDDQASHNREHFDKRGILAINLMSSPGSGKTALLEATLTALKDEFTCAVIEGDLETAEATTASARADVKDYETQLAAVRAGNHLLARSAGAIRAGCRPRLTRHPGRLQRLRRRRVPALGGRTRLQLCLGPGQLGDADRRGQPLDLTGADPRQHARSAASRSQALYAASAIP
jgi:hypothetical protein